jgi:hypothetical protein
MKYKEWKDARQNEFNALPLFWAFGREQFKKAMEERGLTENDTDKLYRLGDSGAMYLKSDADKINAYFKAQEQKPKLADLMRDYDFAKDAIYYEMCNHEYAINYQRNWDVCNCFADEELPYYGDDYYGKDELNRYFDIMNWGDETRRAWKDAKAQYYKHAEENGWF